MTTAALVAQAVLERAADEDDAIDDAKPWADQIAEWLVADLQRLAAQPGVTKADAEQFAATYAGTPFDIGPDDESERHPGLIRLAAIEAAQPVLAGVSERAHGGLPASEAARLERVTRKAIEDHRAQRRLPK